MTRMNVGIIGGGLITQVEHLPNLLQLPGLFAVAGLTDPSATVRTHIAKRWDVPVFDSLDALLGEKLDAVLIATPDAFHADLAIVALERGLHVFSEKPLCYDPADADRVIAARDRYRRVMQVGYMKRFDPAWRALRDMIRGEGERLRYISVDVNDPDSWPFTAHRDLVAGNDVAANLVEETQARRLEQITRALKRVPSTAELKGFAGPYASSMVHDVNLVHGLLDAMGVTTGEVTGAAIFAGSAGGQGAVRLRPGDGLWTVSHVAVPQLSDYTERVSLFFDDRIFELDFPSPYLNHQPTRLTEKRSEGHHARRIDHRPSYEEGFVEELKSWWRAMVEGTPVENTVEDAKRDMELLGAFARKAIGG